MRDASVTGREPRHPAQEPAPVASAARALGERRAQVLVGGGDASTRSKMLGELRNLLPASTRFLEAFETWDLLAHAAESRMVVLAGDLGDVPSETLVRILGRRHPTLPVLAIGSRSGPRAPANGHAASA